MLSEKKRNSLKVYRKRFTLGRALLGLIFVEVVFLSFKGPNSFRYILFASTLISPFGLRLFCYSVSVDVTLHFMLISLQLHISAIGFFLRID